MRTEFHWNSRYEGLWQSHNGKGDFPARRSPRVPGGVPRSIRVDEGNLK